MSFMDLLAKEGDGWDAIVQGIHIPIFDELLGLNVDCLSNKPGSNVF